MHIFNVQKYITATFATQMQLPRVGEPNLLDAQADEVVDELRATNLGLAISWPRYLLIVARLFLFASDASTRPMLLR